MIRNRVITGLVQHIKFKNVVVKIINSHTITGRTSTTARATVMPLVIIIPAAVPAVITTARVSKVRCSISSIVRVSQLNRSTAISRCAITIFTSTAALSTSIMVFISST